MTKMTTRAAAAWLTATGHTQQLSARQLQHWCAVYIESQSQNEPPRGLRCVVEGSGARATYLIEPDDLTAFLATTRTVGWKKGRPRKQQGGGSDNEPPPGSEREGDGD